MTNTVQVLICDNMNLPYKDDSFDAVLSIAVIHHIATTERRVRAIRELARVLRYLFAIFSSFMKIHPGSGGG